MLAYIMSLLSRLVSFFFTQFSLGLTQYVHSSRGSTAPNEASIKGSRPPHSQRLTGGIDWKKEKESHKPSHEYYSKISYNAVDIRFRLIGGIILVLLMKVILRSTCFSRES